MLPKTLADWMPGRPFVEPPLPRFLLHSLGLNPRRAVYWPQIEDKERWDELVGEVGLWAAKRAASFVPLGDWQTLESMAKNLKETVLARM